MSLLTPFGTLEYGDADTMKNWIGPHAIRHMTYVKEMGRRGRAIQTVVLDGQLDSDWFGRHWLNHKAIGQLTDATSSLATINHQWTNENEFYTWHRAHNLVHAKEERAMGMVTE